MIPKPHHKMYYILGEKNRKRFAGHAVGKGEYLFFKDLKFIIRKKKITSGHFHNIFLKLKKYMGIGGTIENYNLHNLYKPHGILQYSDSWVDKDDAHPWLKSWSVKRMKQIVK